MLAYIHTRTRARTHTHMYYGSGGRRGWRGHTHMYYDGGRRSRRGDGLMICVVVCVCVGGGQCWAEEQARRPKALEVAVKLRDLSAKF